jgi:hypothetical protein
MRSSRERHELKARADRQRARLDHQAAQLKQLAGRVAMLEDELHDARSQARRTGELADLVVTLLAQEAARRGPEFRDVVDSFIREL